MAEQDPLVSIVMPMRNTERFVSAALKSILQTQDLPLEVLVVDDNSTDRSADRVREINDQRIVLLKGDGLGVAHASNVALAAARGAFIMFCDSDDLFPAERISQQVSWLEQHPEYEAVCGNYTTIDHDGRPVAAMRCGETFSEITDELKSGRARTHLCTWALRSSLAAKVNGFREFFASGQDIDFQLRCGEAGRVAFVPQDWYIYRIHNSSIIHTQTRARVHFYEQTAYEMQKQRREFGLDDLQKGMAPPLPAEDHSQPRSARTHIQGQLIGRAWQEHRLGRKGPALRLGVRALAADPLRKDVWRSVLALVFKSSPVASP